MRMPVAPAPPSPGPAGETRTATAGQACPRAKSMPDTGFPDSTADPHDHGGPAPRPRPRPCRTDPGHDPAGPRPRNPSADRHGRRGPGWLTGGIPRWPVGAGLLCVRWRTGFCGPCRVTRLSRLTISSDASPAGSRAAVGAGAPRADAGSDFARLSRRIAEAGLLERRPGYYAVRLTLVVGSFAGGWAAFLALGDTWWQLAVAAFLALVFGQVALVAHDLAHRQVFRRRRHSEFAGRLFGNLGVGMSYGWWMN